jgi:hypothetical protein
VPALGKPRAGSTSAGPPVGPVLLFPEIAVIVSGIESLVQADENVNAKKRMKKKTKKINVNLMVVSRVSPW